MGWAVRSGCLLAFVAALAAQAGCGSTSARTYVVTGTVTLDGAALPQGDITFRSLDPDVPSDAGKISNGSFRFQARAGKKRVEIYASRIVPGSEKNGLMGRPKREEIVPTRYNTRSELEVDVTAEGANAFSFELASK